MLQRLKPLIGDSPQLRSLLNTVQTLEELQRHFALAVPAHFAQSCQVTGLRQGTLSIAAGNGTIAAKLRQLAPEIVARLQGKGCEVSGIRVKVQVSYATIPRKRTPRVLTGTAKQQLHRLSENLADSPLKQALEKFSQD